MKLVVGLGNPGREYEATWHNVGFLLVDRLLERSQGRRFRDEGDSKVAECDIAGQKVMLVKPQTFMNMSGNAVRPLLERHGGGDPSNLIIAFDDVALPLGMIRIRAHGSAGGQKGLESIIDRLGTQRFTRIRLGIGPDHPVANRAGFVLSTVPKRDRRRVGEMIERAADAVAVIITDGVERAMLLFNERVRTDSEGEPGQVPAS